MNYNQKFPKEVEKSLNDYISRIKKISWFKPAKDINRGEVESQVKLACEAFGVKASLEFKHLRTPQDWEAAWEAARGAAWGAADILALNLDGYKEKYPKGNFINLIPLWELGLYPVGLVNGKFLVYVPPCNLEFPSKLK